MRRHLRRRKALQCRRSSVWHLGYFYTLCEYLARERGLRRHAARQAKLDLYKQVVLVPSTWGPDLASPLDTWAACPLRQGEIGRIDNFRIVTT